MDIPLSADHYTKWREIHTGQFGSVFSEAFEDDESAQMILTAALIHISQRQFDIAEQRLTSLEPLCVFDFDRAALTYFQGLNYEMLEDEAAMKACYDALLENGIISEFPLAFHPYYRTAKFAQRDAECRKALYYYQKALDFYKTGERTPSKAAVAGCLIYDYATVCLYMHRYDLAEQALALSHNYAPDNNPHRSYVTAILHAVKGRFDDALAVLNGLPSLLQKSGTATVEAIRNGTDLHYGIVHQDKAPTEDFTQWMRENQRALYQLAEQGEISRVEEELTRALTKAFPFMNKPLSCRITWDNQRVTVRCKTYYVKTLSAEYNNLFSAWRKEFTDWCFTAVNAFENYPIQE